MKRYFPVLAIMAVCALPSVVQAAAGAMEGGPGCGLGAMLWADSISKKHIMQQASIATTNLTGFQTFAMSSATSGCTNDGVIARNETITIFVGANFDDLLQQMAQGQGEHLVSLATLISIPPENQPALFSLMQVTYAMRIAAGEQSSVAMLTALRAVMATNPALANAVAQR